jgi:cellulose synthase/poly-beta-1,6-N-acetylglucosamine synthase-like glycosyltransferase
MLVPVILSFYTILIFVSVFTLLFSKKENAEEFLPSEKISVIIPFRNEVENMITCLEGISTQDYPIELIEIILSDDHSEDDSKQIAVDFLFKKGITYKLIDLKELHQSGKKAAIETAVSKATGTIIVTRDADTYTESNLWLKSIAYQFKSMKSDLVLAPVILSGKSFIQTFQRFENIAITCIGYAFAKNKLPFVCSGANLAYKKTSFIKADPYKENKNIATGDDLFLLQAFLDSGFRISAAKNIDCIVYTKAEKSVASFINQRLRWASKAKNLHIKPAWFIGSILFLSNIIILIMSVSCFFGGINWKFCLFTLLYKCIIEFLLLFLGRIMYKQKINFAYYIPAFTANLVYVPLISMASFVVKSKWKGRKQGV